MPRLDCGQFYALAARGTALPAHNFRIPELAARPRSRRRTSPLHVRRVRHFSGHVCSAGHANASPNLHRGSPLIHLAPRTVRVIPNRVWRCQHDACFSSAHPRPPASGIQIEGLHCTKAFLPYSMLEATVCTGRKSPVCNTFSERTKHGRSSNLTALGMRRRLQSVHHRMGCAGLKTSSTVQASS